MQQGHGFGGGGGFIEHGGVGDFHAGEVADHGLKNQQRFETALRDFGLIRRVRRVPAGVFEHVAQDDAGGEAVAIALADVGFEDFIAAGDFAEAAEVFVFAEALREVERMFKADAGRNGLVDEIVKRVCARRFEHLLALPLVGTDVAGGKLFEVKCHGENDILTGVARSGGPACGARTRACRVGTFVDAWSANERGVAMSGDTARTSACATTERIFKELQKFIGPVP